MQIREDKLCLYCRSALCFKCKYTKACQNFCEENVFYPAILTVYNRIGTREELVYDGGHAERMWDN